MGYLDDKQKAVVAFVLTTIGGIATWAVTNYPDNDDVQTWGGLILAIGTVLATTYGVFKARNGQTPVDNVQSPPAPTQLPHTPPTNESDPPLA